MAVLDRDSTKRAKDWFSYYNGACPWLRPTSGISSKAYDMHHGMWVIHGRRFYEGRSRGSATVLTGL